MRQALYNCRFNLTAGEADAHSLMPVTQVVERLIEVATRHANTLNIGYEELLHAGIGWVLSRLSLEMERYPRINEDYAIDTWIEAFNRRYSDRNFDITDGAGNVLGYARSTWVAIDMRNRTMADLSQLGSDAFPCLDRPCPVAPARRLQPMPADAAGEEVRFGYSDIDFNRHVDTVRYLAHVLDHWTLDHHDHLAVARLDMAFNRELRYGDAVTLRVHTLPDGSAECELVRADGQRAASMRIVWRLRRDMD